MQNRVKKLIKELAIKHHLPEGEIETIIATPWRMTAKKLLEVDVTTERNEKKLPVFYHQHLGYFRFSGKKLKINNSRLLKNGVNKKR